MKDNSWNVVGLDLGGEWYDLEKEHKWSDEQIVEAFDTGGITEAVIYDSDLDRYFSIFDPDGWEDWELLENDVDIAVEQYQ